MTPTQSDVLTSMRAFLLAVLPPGTEVIAAQGNRVPEPKATSFVVMTPIRWMRLRTNVDDSADVAFTASILDDEMTVTAVDTGTILDDAVLFGTGVADGTVIVDQVSGPPGGIGVYTISPDGQTVSSEIMASGAKTMEQGAEVTVQLDFHSAGIDASDMAMTVSTVLRDEAGVDIFAEQDLGVVPLYAGEPSQRPFINAEQQYEWRWVVEAMLQANVVVSTPQQYADSVEVEVISVDATYPPS